MAGVPPSKVQVHAVGVLVDKSVKLTAAPEAGIVVLEVKLAIGALDLG